MAIELISAFQDATGYGTFAAWAKWLTTAFTNFGWQQTTDYGQVNWTNLATSNVVPQSSSNTVWTSYVAAASIGTGAGGFAASGGSLVIACAVTTGLAAGKAIQLASLAGAGASAGISAYNGYILTITSVVASTSVTVACPASWSFTYTATAGTVTIQPAFMIFESNDSLSSIAPIYVKLELYAYQNTNTPSFRVTVGLGGTNGYGSLVAPVTAALTSTSYQNDTTNLRPCYASGDAGSFRCTILNPIGVGSNDPYLGQWMVIARSRDTSGNPTSNYVSLWVGGYTAAAPCTFQTVFSAGGINLEDTQGVLIGALANPAAANNFSGAFSGVTMVTPIFQNVGGLSNPTPDFLGGFAKDFPVNTLALITVYGVQHNYISLVSTGAGPKIGPVSSTYAALLFRFE